MKDSEQMYEQLYVEIMNEEIMKQIEEMSSERTKEIITAEMEATKERQLLEENN